MTAVFMRWPAILKLLFQLIINNVYVFIKLYIIKLFVNSLGTPVSWVLLVCDEVHYYYQYFYSSCKYYPSRSNICRQGACNARTHTYSIYARTHGRKRRKYDDGQLQNMSGQGQIKLGGGGVDYPCNSLNLEACSEEKIHILYAFAVLNQTFSSFILPPLLP